MYFKWYLFDWVAGMESFGANTIYHLSQPVPLQHQLASIFLVEVGHLLVFYIYLHCPTQLIA